MNALGRELFDFCQSAAERYGDDELCESLIKCLAAIAASTGDEQYARQIGRAYFINVATMRNLPASVRLN